MGNAKLNNFLSSTALVIDDEVFDEKSTIYNIISTLEKNGTLFVKSRDLFDSIGSLANFSYIILDWDLTKQEEKGVIPEGVLLGEELRNEKKNQIKAFIKNIVESFFIPVFIFSREDIKTIENCLNDDDLLKEAIAKKRIYMRNKSEISDDAVISALESWLNDSMSVYTFKVMDESIEKAKHQFFNEMYKCDLNWPCYVYKTLKDDNSADINSDFQEFLMTSFSSTIEPIVFDASGFDKEVTLCADEIIKIFSKIKFLEYKNNENIGFHSGDLYLSDNNDLIINISPACDMRKKHYYFIKGKSTNNPGSKNRINYYVIENICNKSAIYFDFSKTVILDVDDENKKSIILDNTEFKRIGRLLDPYNTIIQRNYSSYITRIGTLREPKNQ